MNNNNSSNGEQKKPLQPTFLLASPSASVSSSVSSTFFSAAPLEHLPALCESIDSPQGREDVSPRMDQIDNTGLNLALQQENGKQAMFSCIYSWVNLN